MKPYYAHTKGSNQAEWQLLADHLRNTARLAREFCGDPKLSEYAAIVGWLHDIGKYSAAFQRRLEGKGARVDHSTAGAQTVTQRYHQDKKQKYIASLIAFCIAGHHGGLPNYGSVVDTETDNTLLGRLKKEVRDYQDYSQEIDLSQNLFPTSIPIRPIKGCSGFSAAFFTRMVYSLLVDADFLETEAFATSGVKRRGGYAEIEMLTQQLTRHLEQYQNPQNPIDIKRTDILRRCIEKASEERGLFTLTVPTGGGKTLASMAFGLSHALKHQMKKVIYVIPYTSIIEQNAAVFKDFLGKENVLEHHSNFDWKPQKKQAGLDETDDELDDAMAKLKLATENWDVPIVVTTNVQFFESLFANRSSHCRKIHNVANSVIIFDEAQMLPMGYLKPCLYSIHELVKNYGVTAVFCTATQPSIEKFMPEGVQFRELAASPQELYEFFRRVQVVNAGVLADADLAQRINDEPQVLCIVNTRKHARGLFESVVPDGRFHLSTLMCPAHRKATIKEIKERLAGGATCRVVSTQIMEAGIDVDFPVGYRAMAGLDSIIQAAGRVNRERKAESGRMFVFEPDSTFVKRVPAYIEQGADVAGNILRKYSDPVSIQAIKDYYALLYDLQGPQAFDAKNILDCFEKGIPDEPNFDFKTAAENFRFIQTPTVPVIIPFDAEARETLEQVRLTERPSEFFRKLQVYTVNIYEKEFESLQAKGVIDFYADTFAVLNEGMYKEFYDDETGLILPDSTGGEAIVI